MGVPLADQADRDRIRDDLSATLLVEAAAGTGKTTALVGRMLAALASGSARLDRMVAVTFTDAAAGELKLRLRDAIERGRHDPGRPASERPRLEEALPQLEAARIGTIHSFCAELLRERPVEAQVDPQFQVAPDDVARRLFARVFDRWFEAQLAAPGPGVRRALRQHVRGKRGQDGPRGRLRHAAWELVQWRDFPTRWRHEDFDRDAAIDAVMQTLAGVGPAPPIDDRSDNSDRSVSAIERFVADVARREQITGRDYDGLEAELRALARDRHWKWTGFPRDRDPERAARRARRAAAKRELDAFVCRAGAQLAPLLHDDLWPLVEDYERLKGRAGCLDFVDLLLRARDLVRDDAAVRRGLQARWTHLFVDEFQDTDPLQAELLLLLAADDPNEGDWRRVRPFPGKLFLVGDPKQSIYRFRRADVGLYESVKRQLVAAGASVVHLTVSFRSVPAIQDAVNAAFAGAMAGGASPSQAAYVPLAPFRGALPGQPAVIALPVPQPFGRFGRPVDFEIERSLPDAVAAFVEWLVTHSGWRVTDPGRPDAPVPVESRHVCLLFRRMRSWREDMTRPYVRALEARNLRHVLVGGSSFHAREEVEALRNVLLAIERPEDELSLFATLRGPFLALDDGALLAWRDRYRSLHPFRALPEEPPETLAPVAEALALLRELHRHRNRRPFADTIARFLAAVRAHAGLAIWPTGEQALANVGRLLDLARRAERQGLTSFRAFVDQLEADAERAEESEAPIVEDGTDGVRIMTVHRAKGLEFPVVVLADPTANLARSEADRHVDPERRLCALRLVGSAPPELVEHEAEELQRDREEGVRTLYVAATRARDLLVVPVLGDDRMDGWLAPLDPAVYPLPAHAQAPVSVQPPGCPELRGDCVAGPPQNARRSPASVRPGLHRPELGLHDVVWWAPAQLRLRVDEDVGLKQKKLLAADERGDRSEAGVQAHAAWQAERERVREAGAEPLLRVVTATERAASSTAVAEVPLEDATSSGTRPHGVRFGTLVHGVLAAVDLTAGRDTIAATAALHGRLLGATPKEIDAATDAVTHALSHPLLRRAAASPECRREAAIVIRVPDGSIVEGVVDAAFADDDGWTVIDFKTDVELGARRAEYARQVALYAEAIARATGRPARGVLLRV
ncbi:MAG TPA: UvrD-helicase domain-containing protein [Candidatus Binatia bacterium]|nr:UvrD-helicase domain-containing protein [Candidatus Binatia bacterium]